MSEPKPRDWAVVLRLHTVTGLPLSDPAIGVQVINKGDSTKWSTSSLPSFEGTSYLGAWTSFLVRNSEEITLQVVEAAPLINCVHGLTFNASGTLRLEDYISDVESNEDHLHDVDLKLSSYSGDRLAKAATSTLESAVNAADRLSGTSKIITSSPSLARVKSSKASDVEAGTPTTPSAINPLPTSASRLYSLDDVVLHLSVHVMPLEKWTAAPYSYEKASGVLEMDVTSLPTALHSYAHGGFMGLACSILGDEKWSVILKEQDPSAWLALQQIVLKLKLRKADEAPCSLQSAYMTCLENSPVLCAFGMVRTGCVVHSKSAQAQAANEAGAVAAAAPAAAAKPSAALVPPGGQVMTTQPEPVPREALVRYKSAMDKSNTYGYKPLGMEWDIWVNPRHPGSLADASILHGTQTALVAQCITTTVPGMKSCARKAGMSVIMEQGLSPLEWLKQLGSSINIAVNGDADTPLPLFGPEEQCWRVKVGLERASGWKSQAWSGIYVTGCIDSPECVLQEAVSSHGTTANCGEGIEGGSFEVATWSAEEDSAAAMTFWPVPWELQGTDLLLTLNGNPAGIERHDPMGSVRLDLKKLTKSHPSLLTGEEVTLEVDVGPTSKRYKATSTSAAAGPSAIASTPQLTPRGAAPGGMKLAVRLRLEPVGVISAAEGMGVPRVAAQTAIAMLSSPGGLYLDVKSAYSTAEEIQKFVSVMRGVGLTCKAVCSFKPEQLEVGGVADTVLFFHGLAGLENSADAGKVKPGQFVLFNGASFLQEFNHTDFQFKSEEAVADELSQAKEWPVDPLAVRKYLSLVHHFGVVGGIYIQEPDTAPAGVDALCKLVSKHAEMFPLGLAYGHVSGRAVAFFDAKGRGFASQQILEELAARKDLAGKTIRRIHAGEHRGASLDTAITWAERLMRGRNWMSRAEQRALVILLAEIQPAENVVTMVEELGGVEQILVRFHEHYELMSPLTLMEAGWNLNYAKSLLRVLRNRGVLSQLTMDRKLELAGFLVSGRMRGFGLTYLLQSAAIRRGLHKHSKEGLLCLLESCTAPEATTLLEALGGEEQVQIYLKGRLRLSWSYSNRFEDVKSTHAADPSAFAYHNSKLKYAALPYEIPVDSSGDKGGLFSDARRATHTRDKRPYETGLRVTRKSLCCVYTTMYSIFLEIITLGTFIPCCVLPRFCGQTLKGACGVPAVITFVLATVVAIIVVIVLVAGDGVTDD